MISAMEAQEVGWLYKKKISEDIFGDEEVGENRESDLPRLGGGGGIDGVDAQAVGNVLQLHG